jgi:hypothetical protein
MLIILENFIIWKLHYVIIVIAIIWLILKNGQKSTNLFVFCSQEMNLQVACCDQIIDAHGLKIQGRGYGIKGGQGLMKNCQGGTPILRFIAYLLTSCSKMCPGGCCFIPPSPPYPPVCICGSDLWLLLL